jgi:hypothetical protein
MLDAPWFQGAGERVKGASVGNLMYFTLSRDLLPNSEKMGWHFASPYLLMIYD